MMDAAIPFGLPSPSLDLRARRSQSDGLTEVHSMACLKFQQNRYQEDIQMPNADRKVAGLGRLLRRSFVFACLASLLLCPQVGADPIVVYAQLGSGNTATLTNHGDGTESITSSTDVVVTNIAGQGNL